MKVGLFGGAFNPPHQAHVRIGLAVLRQFQLDHLVYMPTGKAPHKVIESDERPVRRLMWMNVAAAVIEPERLKSYLSGFGVYPSTDESETLSRIYAEYYRKTHDDRISVSDYEINYALEHDSETYTVDTLRYLDRRYPEAERCLIIGSDQAVQFDRWKDYTEILSSCTIVYALRNPDDEPHIEQKFPKMIKIDWKPANISSTEVRQNTDDSRLKMILPEPIYFIYCSIINNRDIKG